MALESVSHIYSFIEGTVLTDVVCSQEFILLVMDPRPVLRSHVFSVVCYSCSSSTAHRRDYEDVILGMHDACIYK